MSDLNALIAQGIQFKEPPNPFVQYAQMQQLQQGEQTNQLNQMKMAEYQRGLQESNRLRDVVSQPGFDPMNPTHQAAAYAVAPSLAPTFLEKSLTTKESSGKIVAANIKAKADKQSMLAQAYRDISQNPSDAQITAHLEDVLASNIFSPTEMTSIKQSASDLLALPFEQRQAKLSTRGASAADLKPQVVAEGASLVPVGAIKPSFIAPHAALPPDVEAQKIRIAGAGAPRVNVPVNVSTEKKYSEQFGSAMAAADTTLLETARKAPDQAATANRILELTKNAKLFTGTGANIKLSLAKALNMTGATDTETAANTETLIAAMGKGTLDAIKSSGLGAGQGFTDNDLKFLQRIAGGNITMEKTTIERLAELQHKVAVQSARKWEERKKNMPAAALEGTGIDKEVILVPARGSAPAEGSWGYIGPVK